jgi:hypothetical protein
MSEKQKISWAYMFLFNWAISAFYCTVDYSFPKGNEKTLFCW